MSVQLPTAALNAAVRAHLCLQLRMLYGDPTNHKMPLSLRRLVNHAAHVIRAHTEPVDQAFMDGILAALPHLRAFAYSLTRDVAWAEDLAQDTILLALSKQEMFAPGTCLQAWLFTILRNRFYSTYRTDRREVQDANGVLAARLSSPANQEGRLIMQELAAALAQLPPDQREVLVLLGVDGLSYEEAATKLGCVVGTIKSRVSRARDQLAALLQFDPDEAAKHGLYGNRWH